MSVSDQDFELLDSWLDGELPESEINALRARLQTDSQLSQTLERLQDHREMRAAMWQTMEPEKHRADALVSAVRAAALRDDVWSKRLRWTRGISAVAASVALVFSAGWLSHQRLQSAPQNSNGRIEFQQPQAIAQNSSQQPQAGAINFVSQPYRLRVLDPQGRIVADQPLNHLDDPHKFTDEMGRFQMRQPQRQPSDPVFVDYPK